MSYDQCDYKTKFKKLLEKHKKSHQYYGYIFKCSDIQMFRYRNVQILKCPVILMCIYLNMQVQCPDI